MFDLGWTEMAIIIIIGLIVIGPKDLPTAIRAVSRGIARVRAMSDEFRSGVDEIIREAELKDLGKDVERTIGYDPADKFSILESGPDDGFDTDFGPKTEEQRVAAKKRAAANEKQGRARDLAERMKRRSLDSSQSDEAGETTDDTTGEDGESGADDGNASGTDKITSA